MAIKLLSDCRKCSFYKELAYGSLVICSQLKDIGALIISQPSHDNPGFSNGTMIVLCRKD